MINHRLLKLKKNFQLMFWVKALTEVKVINVVSTLFFVHRGLNLSNILTLSIVYAIVNIIAEVPSSYLADKIGRKIVIILSLLSSLSYWIISIFANSFNHFIFAFILLSLASALLSGTDEALVYDTSKELDDEKGSLKELGRFYSAQKIFKIFVPILAVYVAKNLNDTQFIILLLVDVIANITALSLSFSLTEPSHYAKLEKLEAGIIKDSLSIFSKTPNLLRVMLNKSILFIALFMLWRISSDFFVNNNITILTIGIITTIYQSIIYIYSYKIDTIIPSLSTSRKIECLNIITTVFLAIFLINYLTINNSAIYIICFVISITSESIRSPLFSDLINKFSSSYNRATTISLNNFLQSALSIPLLFLSSYLIALNYTYFFIFILALSIIPTLMIKISSNSNH